MNLSALFDTLVGAVPSLTSVTALTTSTPLSRLNSNEFTALLVLISLIFVAFIYVFILFIRRSHTHKRIIPVAVAPTTSVTAATSGDVAIV